MATQATQQDDDLSDVVPEQASQSAPTSKLSPYLIMQAQKEQAAGQPGPATAQLGAQALKAGLIHPADAAMHAEKAGFVPPGTSLRMAQQTMRAPAAQPGGASPQPAPTSPAAREVGSDEDRGPIDLHPEDSSQNSVSTLAKIAKALTGKEEQSKPAAPRTNLPVVTAEDPNAPGPTQANVGDSLSMPAPENSLSVLSPEELADRQNTFKSMTGKNLNLSSSADSKNTNSATMHQNVGAVNGAYGHALRQIMGYNDTPVYAKNPDGSDDTSKPPVTYDLADSPDSGSIFQKQKGALAKIQDLVNQRAAQPQAQRPTNLTGLMMAADFLNGTHTFVPGYQGQRKDQAEDTAYDDKQSEQNVGNQIQALKGQNDLYKEAQQGALGVLNGGAMGTAAQTAMALKMAEDSKQPGNMTTPTNQVMSQIQKTFKPIQDEETEADKVTALVNSHNPAAISGIKEALTRLMTGARPQMQLIQTQAQDPGLGQRMESYLSLASTGQLPVENVAQMNQMVSDLNKVNSGRRAIATAQMQAFGSQMNKTPDETNALIPSRASPQLVQQAASEGAKSVKVQEGKAAAKQVLVPPHGPTVTQNGHTYTWNPSTKKYE